MRRRQPIELGDDVVEQGDGARRAEPLGQLGEADQIAEQDRGLGHAVGDLLVGPRLQPLGDRLGQDVDEQGVGFGPRPVGHGEGVADDQRDDAEGGDGGGYIKIGEQGRVGGDRARSGGNRNHAAICSARPMAITATTRRKRDMP